MPRTPRMDAQTGTHMKTRAESLGRWAVFTTIFLHQLFAAPLAAQNTREVLSTMPLDSLLGLQIHAASRYAQTVEHAPASVTIITHEQIERFGYRTLDEVLQAVRGFYTSYDRNYAYIGVRGFSRPTDYNNRIVLLLNGHVLNESVYNLIGAGSELGLDLNAVERIEIVRGPGSALYGTGAVFAVINIVPRQGARIAGGRFAARLGSAGERELSGLVGERIGKLDVLASVRWGERDGTDLYFPEYDELGTSDGIARGLDWERRKEVLALAAYGDVALQVRANRRHKGVPTGAWGSVFNDGTARTVDEWGSVALSFERALTPATRIFARAHANSYSYHGWYPLEPMWQDANDGRWGGLELQLTRDFGPAHRLVAGGGYMRSSRSDYRAYDASDVFFEGDYPYDVLSLYVQHEAHLAQRVSLTGGIRYDGHSETRNVFSPRLALIYAPANQTTLKALYGSAFRTPSVYERFYVADDFKRVVDLVPERIRTFELTWQQRLRESVFGTVSLYHNHLAHLIDTRIDSIDGLLYFDNLQSARAYGLEVEVQGDLRSGLSGYASWGAQRTVDLETDDQLTNSPAHLGKAGLSAAFFDRFTTGAELRFESGRTTVYGTETDATLVTNLHITAPRFWRGLHASLRVRNALDSKYYTPGGYEHMQAAIRQDGRTLNFELGYRFE
jgi:outer membrane receptor protein involved in Fe transport